MPEKRKKEVNKKLSRIHESSGTLLDIDADQIPVFRHYRRVVGVALPEQFFTTPGAWKEEDREFFFHNFMVHYRVRETTKAERDIPIEISKLIGQPIPDANSLAHPFFKYVMVFNIMPGCRLKASVDGLLRKPDDIVLMSGLQVTPFMSTAPTYQPLQDYIERVHACWVAALRLRADEQERRADEDRPDPG